MPIRHLKYTLLLITWNICHVPFSVYLCISHLPQCLAPVPLCSGWKVTTVEGLGAKVFHFLTFHEIWLFLLIFHSMCSQTTIQSNSSSPLTEEPSVDSAGFQISWLSMISHLPALSFLYCCLFLSQPRHGDAAALLPAGAPGRHHGADRQHLGRQPLQVDCIMHIPHFIIPSCK